MRALREERQNRVQFLVAHQRFAADDRDVQRTMTVDEVDDAVDERLSLEVAYFAECERRRRDDRRRTRNRPGQRSGHSRVISIERAG